MSASGRAISNALLANVARGDGDEMIEQAERVGLRGQGHVPFQRGAADPALRLLAARVEDALARDRTDQDGERCERAPPVEPGLGGRIDVHDALQGSAPEPAAGPGIPTGVTRAGIRFHTFVRPRDAVRQKNARFAWLLR